jgi:hypothetical protein
MAAASIQSSGRILAGKHLEMVASAAESTL